MKGLVQAVIAAASIGTVANAADDAKEQQRIRVIAAKYAACVIAQSSSQARRFVVEQGQPPINGDCLVDANKGMGGEMRFPGQHYRYALAGALLARDFPGGVPSGVAAAPDLPHDEPAALDEAKLPKNAKRAAAARDDHTRWRAYWLMDTLGDCTARQDPAGAYTLVRSEVGSPSERQAFEALKPAIGGCMGADTTIHFAASTLRGAIALNLYRLAYSVGTPGHA